MINRVILVGRLTKDVEVKQTATGISTATVTVACDRDGKKEDGKQNADFPQVVVWRQGADFLGQYAKKGTLVGIDGRLQTRSYDNQNGTTVYVTEVVAEKVKILDGWAKDNAKEEPQEEVEEVEIAIESDDIPF